MSIEQSLKAIIKWAGGKEKELKYIIPNLPKFNRYYEPFVGGGSVFMAMQAMEYFINDRSAELIALYNNIATVNKCFFRYAEAIDYIWKEIETFCENSRLSEIYESYRNDEIDKSDLKNAITLFCNSNNEDICNLIKPEFSDYENILVREIKGNLYRKMSRMHDLELTKNTLPQKDIKDNILCAMKSALYMFLRHLYNDNQIKNSMHDLHNALFLFIRNYSYSGMFRYNTKGEFNVPYGGIGYNNKTLQKKLEYYKSDALHIHLNKTHIYNLDFEDFLNETTPCEDDFVFLDPPYDSDFSTYAQNEFTKHDQQRLAEFMLNKCKAKWMLIIKNTDFIYNLYSGIEGINIRTFNKNYLVSFMNRNNRKAEHLLITNYT
jgi:DNA adenine methylase